MPIFAAFFGALFSSLAVFLAKMFAAKLAIRVLGVAALTALAAGLMTTFNNAISPLVQQLFQTQYGQFLGLAFPPIAGTVISVYLSVLLAIGTYRLQARAVTLTAGM
jgi:phosphotransferase system  glucose/maltose/N-acetylglucosamine-specific IIC component